MGFKIKLKSIAKLTTERSIAVFTGTVILWLSDFIFYTLQSKEKFPRPLAHGLVCFILSFLLSFAFTKKGYWRFILLFSMFGFFQMLSVSYFGSFMSPVMIYLFFKDAGEVAETFLGVWKSLWQPVLIQFLILFLILKIKQYRHDVSWSVLRYQKILKFILVFALIYPGLRTAFTGHTFGKQAVNHELGFVNFYGALSYFFAKVLPNKLAAQTTSSGPAFNLKIIEATPQRHVVMLLGESLALNRMQIFGYNKETTPFLNQLKKQNQLFFLPAVSGGVSTDVAIPLLIHGATPGVEASSQIASQSNCIFKLAKENGFETHFYSVQPVHELKHIINYLCPKYIDHFEIEKSENGEVLDSKLLDYEKNVNWNDKPQFVLFHQRGSHSPYETRYPKDFNFFKSVGSESEKDKQLLYYDNSVRFTDEVIKSLIEQIQKNSSGKKYPMDFIITSDHGEALGENGYWGHVILQPIVAEVPFIYLHMNQSNQIVELSSEQLKYFRSLKISEAALNIKNTDVKIDKTIPSNISEKLFQNKSFDWISHQNIAYFTYLMLGYDTIQPLDEKFFYKTKFTVMGPDIDGLAGEMEISPKQRSAQ